MAANSSETNSCQSDAFHDLPPGLLPGGTFDLFVSQQAAQDQFSGTVLLSYRGCPVLSRSYGMANKDLSIPNSVDTIFALGSLAKIFTGVAVGQLAAQGAVQSYATLGTYLSGFPSGIADVVTVHQLLTHTSGMGNYQTSPVWQADSRTWATAEQEFDDTMAIIRQSPLLFTPGTAYSYSNSGYYTLAAIVAQVSGQAFLDYVREHIFAPAGMVRTNYYTLSQWKTNPNFAHAYGPVQANGRRTDITAETQAFSYGGGAGGGFSTAPDLLAFARVLQEGRLLNPGYTYLITSGKYPIAPNDHNPDQPPAQWLSIGYGFEERAVNNQRISGHAGASPIPGGISTNLSIYFDLDWVAVILSNYYINIVPFLQLEDQLITALRAHDGSGTEHP
jgi:CubicO group peptidase (beta-lactamase class C family)